MKIKFKKIISACIVSSFISTCSAGLLPGDVKTWQNNLDYIQEKAEHIAQERSIALLRPMCNKLGYTKIFDQHKIRIDFHSLIEYHFLFRNMARIHRDFSIFGMKDLYKTFIIKLSKDHPDYPNDPFKKQRLQKTELVFCNAPFSEQYEKIKSIYMEKINKIDISNDLVADEFMKYSVKWYFLNFSVCFPFVIFIESEIISALKNKGIDLLSRATEILNSELGHYKTELLNSHIWENKYYEFEEGSHNSERYGLQKLCFEKLVFIYKDIFDKLIFEVIDDKPQLVLEILNNIESVDIFKNLYIYSKTLKVGSEDQFFEDYLHPKVINLCKYNDEYEALCKFDSWQDCREHLIDLYKERCNWIIKYSK